ncbi:MAG TPA: hypothetical protein VFL13_08370 [Candidatus Baltobacteraceae bacterium]|nr:hypothetical protein [Candidatus Baltobacteraceae bacterium]
MNESRRPVRHRVRAYAYTLVTGTVVLLFALAEWAAERFVSERSRAASTALEIAIVLVAALVFRPIHQYVESRLEAAFYRRRGRALAAIERTRHGLTAFGTAVPMLDDVFAALEQHFDAAGCAVYVRRDAFFRREAATFAEAPEAIDAGDPVFEQLLQKKTAFPPALHSALPGTHAFALTAGGHLVGALCLQSRANFYDDEEQHGLRALAADLAVALLGLDPLLRAQRRAGPSNLPAALPELVGRENEIAEIGDALRVERLVTLTGPGGVGKTSVALQCGANALARYEDGVWFVDLAPIEDDRLVVSAILEALGSAVPADDVQPLVEHLRPRSCLLIVDNCEHVLSAAAGAAGAILASCPGTAILATSRELLHLSGEHVYHIGPLAGEPAADLFARRARAVRASFDLDRDRESVRSICERLDGIPLAIELAAARTRAMSVADIAAHLRERFRLLESGTPHAQQRQQTLASLIEWSYDLLKPGEQSQLRRMSVFRGSFSLPAAVAVCAHGGDCDEYHVLDELTSLCDKSLLQMVTGEKTRYRFLETIRAFAEDRAAEISETADAASQHAAYFAALAARAYVEFDTHLPANWLQTLAPDVDNFRAALGFALDGDGDRVMGAQMAADCGPVFLRLELLAEGLRWCERARGVEGLAPATAARIEYVASMMHNNLGETPAALSCAQRAAALYRNSSDERGMVRALSQVAQQFARAKRFEDAKAPAAEAIRRAKALGEPRIYTGVLRRCAYALPPEHIEEARALFSQALDAARSSHDTEEAALVLNWWASREAVAGCFARAVQLASESLAAASGNALVYQKTQILGYAFAGNDTGVAAAHAADALRLTMEAQNPLLFALAASYAVAVCDREDAMTAVLLSGYAAQKLQALAWIPEPDDVIAFQHARQALEAIAAPEDLSVWLERGAALSDEEAHDLAAELLNRERDRSSSAVQHS